MLAAFQFGRYFSEMDKTPSGGSNPLSPARLALAAARGNAGERAHHSLSTAKTLLKDCAGRIHGPETVARYFGAG
jgi:hypothetical protein